MEAIFLEIVPFPDPLGPSIVMIGIVFLFIVLFLVGVNTNTYFLNTI
tara:strand:- start:46 stop:186 length:141 start_codon:yes stop_codon:yes gene_type:complete